MLLVTIWRICAAQDAFAQLDDIEGMIPTVSTMPEARRVFLLLDVLDTILSVGLLWVK